MTHPWNVPEVIRLSNSTCGALESCDRKFEFAKLYLHPRERDNVNTGSGKALHEGYQEWLISRDRTKAFFKMALNYPIYIESNPNHFRSLEACYATLECMMNSNQFLEYELAQVECLDGVIRPAVEVAFEITIPPLANDNFRFIYVGKIDMIFFNKATGQFIVVDIKTHRDKYDRTVKYQFDDQMVPYSMILQAILKRDVGDLNMKYFDVYLDIMEPKTQVYSFEKTQEDVNDWAKTLRFQIQKIKTFIDAGWFPRNGGSTCAAYNNQCAYFDACHSRDPEFIQKQILGFNEPYVEHEIIPWVRVDLDLAA